MDDLLFMVSVVVTGLSLGAIFLLVWRKILPASYARQFWKTLLSTTKTLLHDPDPDQFFVHYKRLMIGLGGYLGRNLLGLSAGLLPLILVMIFLWPVASDWWHVKRESVWIYPAGTPNNGIELQKGGDPASGGLLLIKEQRIPLGDLSQRHGLCWDQINCLLLESLLFQVVTLDKPIDISEDYIIVRPGRGPERLEWPLLNTFELAFFLSLFVGSLIALALSRKKP
jgi:hypothetical protein